MREIGGRMKGYGVIRICWLGSIVIVPIRTLFI